MEFFTKAVSLIFSLSILVVLHELGHFIPAKIFKTKVEKFYLFFDPWFSLVKKKIGDTVYGIGWLPLGGYVKISGMVDESMDKEQMKQPPKSWEFRSKKTWQRLIIMVGGVTVNALLAWFIYSMSLLTWGEDRLPNTNLKYGIATTEIARDHGFKNGDIPVSINGEKFDFFSDFTKELLLNDKEKEIVVLRDGEEFTFKLYDEFGDHALDSGIHRVIAIRIPFIVDSIPPISETIESTPAQGILKRNDQIIGMNGLETPFNNDISKILKDANKSDLLLTVLRDGDTLQLATKLNCKKLLGVHYKGVQNFLESVHYNYSFSESFPAGFTKALDVLGSYVRQFKKVARHADSLGGFGALGSLFPESFSDTNYWQKFWNITALLSIILAFMNLLPIPALDGGHVMFLLYEMIFRRKPGEKFMEYAQMTGMILLLGLMLYANGNDIFRSFFGGEEEPKKDCWEQVAENIPRDNPLLIYSSELVNSNKFKTTADDSMLMKDLNLDS